ncbi:protein C20orf121, putative [Pediculus humanus corporis]|uniref:Protein C20orf121, putative n=1 Tax=Pediculus humanus subsp. corporis TaxID=121224 RepID=E0VDE6_PEDHC|nr:protein C20orf121, putative [Pediculus humanus corporis]EEB11402.1 protein C20orf121, putative [Pediculus humanus corporis]
MSKQRFEDVKFELELEMIPEKVLEWSRNHGENDKDIKIYELRELIYERGDVVPHRTDDAYLLKFLRARSFNIESTYKLLVNYYNFKENNPELHENVNPLHQTFVGAEDVIQVLPYRDENERRIIIIKLGNWNTSKYTVEELLRSVLLILELGSLEPASQILGVVILFDFKNVTISHLWHITPSVAKKIMELMVTSFPLKMHIVNIIFESKVFDLIYKLFQPLLSSKMKKKIFFHGNDLDSLHNHIQPKYLPKRYGGIRPKYKYDKWIEYVKISPNVIEELRSLGYIITDEIYEKKLVNSSDEKTSSDED